MNDKRELGFGINGGDATSSDPAITRKEFITKVMKGVAITGGVMLAPKVLDKFILPAQAAGTSTKANKDVTTHNHTQTDILTLPSGANDSPGDAADQNGGYG
jgi:hypothetical protein